jgi:hypothetical protein
MIASASEPDRVVGCGWLLAGMHIDTRDEVEVPGWSPRGSAIITMSNHYFLLIRFLFENIFASFFPRRGNDLERFFRQNVRVPVNEISKSQHSNIGELRKLRARMSPLIATLLQCSWRNDTGTGRFGNRSDSRPGHGEHFALVFSERCTTSSPGPSKRVGDRPRTDSRMSMVHLPGVYHGQKGDPTPSTSEPEGAWRRTNGAPQFPMGYWFTL